MSFWDILGTLLIKPLQLLFEVVFVMANRVVGDPGLAIIALSLAMNFLVLPLYRRADAMQEEERETELRLHKGVAHIKKTFRGDERMMMLQTYYRQNNYKPTYVLKGATSLFLEIPFFIAAYAFLSNLELLHAVLASTMPYGRLSARYRGKRKAELQSRIAMVESVLETRGDQLAKAEQIMYLDTAERSAICHYLGIIYTRLIAQKLYGIDCMVPLNLIEQPGEKKFVKYNGAYRQDLIGYGKQNAWSVWEPVGRSENSQAAFGNGCRAASEIEKINENPLAKSAACMTYYERGYLNAVVKEPERTGDGTLWFPEENYFKAYYQPLFELFADEQPGELYGSSGGFEMELTLPWTEEGKRGFRHLQIGTDQVTLELMREGKYDQIFKQMETVLDVSKEHRFCGEDGIWVGAE